MAVRVFSSKCGKCRQKAMTLPTVPYSFLAELHAAKPSVTAP